jgi:hypothetical protein
MSVSQASHALPSIGRIKRRFYRLNLLVFSVEGLYRDGQLHKLAALVKGDGGRNFWQRGDPGLHKSREPHAMPLPKMIRDDQFDRSTDRICGRVTHQLFCFSAPAADLASRIYSDYCGHRLIAHPAINSTADRSSKFL